MFWSCVLLGEKWNNGLPAALAPLPEWPSLRFDYRQNFGFDNGMFEPGRLPDLAAFGDSREWTGTGKKSKTSLACYST